VQHRAALLEARKALLGRRAGGAVRLDTDPQSLRALPATTLLLAHRGEPGAQHLALGEHRLASLRQGLDQGEMLVQTLACLFHLLQGIGHLLLQLVALGSQRLEPILLDARVWCEGSRARP
jgi:hypothetical protein